LPGPWARRGKRRGKKKRQVLARGRKGRKEGAFATKGYKKRDFNYAMSRASSSSPIQQRGGWKEVPERMKGRGGRRCVVERRKKKRKEGTLGCRARTNSQDRRRVDEAGERERGEAKGRGRGHGRNKQEKGKERSGSEGARRGGGKKRKKI